VLRGTFKSSSRGIILRRVLVVAQFSLSIALIVTALVISNQINFMTGNPGFKKDNMVIVPISGTPSEHYEPLKTGLLNNPDILAVTATSRPPTRGSMFNTDGVKWPGKDPNVTEKINVVSVADNYLETFQIEVLEGQAFKKAQASTDKRGIIINEEALRMMNLEEPVGTNLYISSGFEDIIIGVVKDYHYRSFYDRIEPLAIVCWPEYFDYMCISVSGDNLPQTLAGIETVWKNVLPNYPYKYSFLDGEFDKLYKYEQRFGAVINYFAAFAMLISCLGLMGLASFSVEQRIKEIGVRKVLGASVSSVLVLFSSEFIRWVLLSNLIAWPLAYIFINRWLENFAYRTSINWLVFAGAGLVTLMIAVLTISFQTIKAANTNPAKILRHD